MPVGSDVLDRRSTHGTGDPCETFDAAELLFAGRKDELVPVRTGGDPVADAVGVDGDLHWSVDFYTKHDAGKSRIGYEEIASSAENEERQTMFSSKMNAFQQCLLVSYVREEAGGPSDAQRRERGEGDIFLDVDGSTIHGLEGKSGRGSQPK